MVGSPRDPEAGTAIDWDRIGLVGSAMIGVIVGVAMIAGIMPLPGDAEFYWLATPGEYAVSAYVYPPVLAQLLTPLHWFDAWQVFTIGWMTLCFASLGYVLGRWSFVAMALAIPGSFLPWMEPVTGPISSVLMGNVTLPMVAAMVAATRHPALWAVPILTKITPGVGLLWFAFRREWHALVIGMGVSLGVMAVSFALSPEAWVSFARFAIANAGADVNGPPIVGPPLWLRLPAAVLLVAWGARTDHPRILPIAGALAVVGLYGWGTITSIAVGVLAAHHPRPRGPSQMLAAVTTLARRNGLPGNVSPVIRKCVESFRSPGLEAKNSKPTQLVKTTLTSNSSPAAATMPVGFKDNDCPQKWSPGVGSASNWDEMTAPFCRICTVIEVPMPPETPPNHPLRSTAMVEAAVTRIPR